MTQPDPLSEWQEKLAALQVARARLSDPAQQFTLDKQIQEAEGWVRKLQARSGRKDGPHVDLSHLPAGAAHFLGRGPELAALDAAWAGGDGSASGTAVVELIAPGGTGKTALVKRWLDGLRNGQSVSVSESESGSGSGSGSGSESIPIPIPTATATPIPTPQEHQPWRGAAQIFAWSFYSQGTGDDRQASEDLFLASAIDWFGVRIDPAANPADKGRVLAQALIAARTLLILDGLEPLQYPPGPLAGELRAPGLKALLTQLAAVGQPGLCVVTSREWLQDLAEWVRAPDHRQTAHPGGSVLRIDLGNLGDTDGAALLHARGANRAGAAVIGPHDPELIAASQAVQGHALTLSLLGGYLALAHDGDIRRRDQVDLGDADAELSSGHVRRVMAAYETWFARAGETRARELAALRLFGLFDRPASAALLAALRAAPPIPGLTEALFTGTAGVSPDGTAEVSSATARSGVGASGLVRGLWLSLRRRKPPGGGWPAGSRRSQGPAASPPAQPIADHQWRIALTRLEQIGLLAPADADGSRDAHPLIREHLAATLREREPAAWREGHRRLYEWLKASVPHRPDGLQGLQPLYQAVAHGCLAGQWQQARAEVYRDRILRGTGNDGFYSSRKLGAFGADLSALVHLFAEPWQCPAPALSAPAQAWLLNAAAFRLRALGRLAEALAPMRAGAEMAVAQQAWKSAAASYGNLSQLQLALGRIDAAVADARRSVEYADRSGDAFQRMSKRTTLADALHQQGEVAEAQAAFAEAEAMQAERQPQYPLLYSLRGFRYCDLLLAAAERAAWSGPGDGLGDGAGGDRVDEQGLGAGADGAAAGPLADCAEVARRAKKALDIVLAGSRNLLDIGLNHLTLARCALYSDRLQGRPPGPEARDQTERALDRLRAAGHQEFIIHGLLTRAQLHQAQGDPAAADADLREAERIASRGGMALHLADLALTRARLFHDAKALATARRLIDTQGYRRRLPELQDAEAAAANWPRSTPAATDDAGPQ